MSNWIEPKKEDIDLSDDKKEIHIYLFNDDFGANYVSIKVKDIIDLLLKNGILES
jgi:hypothetical protein